MSMSDVICCLHDKFIVNRNGNGRGQHWEMGIEILKVALIVVNYSVRSLALLLKSIF